MPGPYGCAAAFASASRRPSARVARNGKTPHARSTTSEEAILARQDGGAMRAFRHGLVLALVVMLACGQVPSPALSQTGAAPAGSSQLDKLVAPVPVYPPPLLAQILHASSLPRP